MKAIVHAGMSGVSGLSYGNVTDKQPGYGEVKVKLKSAGSNHRDLFLMANRTERDTLGWEDAHNVPSVLAIVGGPSDGTFAEFDIIPA